MVLAAAALSIPGLSAQEKKEPVDYVNPYIGGIGHLLTATSPTGSGAFTA
jgi:hypothetical protein